ncbi:MAG TPA: hypothetical protein VKS98_07300 [Chthoniobacterales bacterium]|nr:hypothetical protein [Chthoniobacterales bacterium]
MKNLGRRALILLIGPIVIGASGTLLGQDEPGPFERLFRAIRHGFNEPQHHSKSHRNSSSHKQTAGNTETGDDQSNVANETSGGVGKPPNQRNTKSTSRAVTKKGEDLPYGTPVAGKQGFVTSPFSPNSGYIDVRGFAPGTPVKDPYSGKVFLTP